MLFASIVYRSILNSLKFCIANSSNSIPVTRAFGGPALHQSVNADNCSFVPVAIILTDLSERFFTNPVIPKRIASSLVLCRKKTPCTFPFTEIEIV
jgi:hypothetical protein